MKYRKILASVLAGFLISAPAMAEVAKKKDSSDSFRLLNLFGDVFERVRSDYVEEPTDQELIESAINGMLTALDPHSSYLNPKNFREMQVQTKGEFGGLGLQITMEDGLIKVISPIDDTPAFRAGLKPGDLISHIDNAPVQGMNLSEAVEKMRGRVGSEVSLTILRKGLKPFDVVITRAIVKVASVRSRLEGKIGYLRITSFNEQSDKDVEKAMSKFMTELGGELQGIVLDLRNNPGGLLDQAVNVTDIFLDKGEIVSTRSRDLEKTQRYNAHPGDLAKNLPIVVLINSGSASASEIVAGALKDHRRAVILGVKSFGKGSVQTIIPLSGGAAMRLTTARYYTPSGISIQGVGIEPDIIVEQASVEPLEKTTRRREADLRGALENDNGVNGGEDKTIKKEDKKPDGAKKNEGAKKENEQPKEQEQDYQLDRALDLLRGLSLYSKLPKAPSQ